MHRIVSMHRLQQLLHRLQQSLQSAVLFCLCALLLAVEAKVSAQTTETRTTTSELGLMVSGAVNLHNASFRKLGDVRSCCPEFSNGFGLGWSAGAFYTHALSDVWRLQARFSYAQRSGTLTDEEKSFVADLRDSARVIEALFTHEIEATITDLGFEPLLLFRPVGRLDLMLGGRIALPLVTRFHQTETLTEPRDYGEYLGVGRLYVDTTAEIPEPVKPQFSLALGMRYVIPFSKLGSPFLSPELQYTLPLTHISTSTNWSVSHLRFGLAFGIALGAPSGQVSLKTHASDSTKNSETRSEEPTSNISSPTSKLTASVRVKGLTAVHAESSHGEVPHDGSLRDESTREEVDVVTIHVEEIAATELLPISPIVYFDSASTNWIPQQLAARKLFEVNPDSMGLEAAIHAAPWVLAKRLAERPDVRVRLIGTTSDIGSDKGLALARERAQSVKEMLVAKGVSAAAISIEARRIPDKPTTASDSSQATIAAAENRRVEIEVSDPSILAPFTIHRIERAVDPPGMRAYLEVHGSEGTSKWHVDVHQGSHQLASFNGEGAVLPSVEWELERARVPLTEQQITVDLRVESQDGDVVVASDTVPVSLMTIRRKRVERIAGREIERLNLLLFEFNDTRVLPENTRLIESIRSRITPRTEVTIYGLSDELGSSAYNKELSYRRAAEVAAILNVPQGRIVGMGEENLKYSTNSPVARSYNRTVVIELVTPVP